MIVFFVNSQLQTQPRACSLQQWLDGLQDAPESFALAVNGSFVARAAYAQTAINNGDKIDLVVPVSGG